MASPTEYRNLRTVSLGRGFASMDPERQGEVPGRLVRASDNGPAAARARSARLDWLRVQPDRDASIFEGSSSRRSR